MSPGPHAVDGAATPTATVIPLRGVRPVPAALIGPVDTEPEPQCTGRGDARHRAERRGLGAPTGLAVGARPDSDRIHPDLGFKPLFAGCPS